MRDEPLLFELGAPDRTGVDLPAPPDVAPRLGTARVRAAVPLPGLAEPEAVRHYTRLSQLNYGIDTGIYPLGSCTMKHNPRLNEALARLPGFADAHPLQPPGTVQGSLAVMHELAEWLLRLTGMAAVTLVPAAGAHGELCGMMAIRAALERRGERRGRVLVPASAHGTNPATAAALGYAVQELPANARGRIDADALAAALGPDVAAVMVTNPNTCGLFEDDLVALAARVHDAGAYLYGDGANFNAIVGRVRPAALGLDAMHLNLHKTFSTPHGGGGPGSGPVVFAASLAPHAPVPQVIRAADGTFALREHAADAAPGTQPIGRLRAFHGQAGTWVRALAYLLAMGGDGLARASGDAVLNANYLRVMLAGVLHAAFPGPCMHEVLFDDGTLEGTGVTTLDVAKALLDEGLHPMTVYFPLIVHGAMLVEPTETESKASLDGFVAAVRRVVERARAGDRAALAAQPLATPRRRLDELRAAKAPVLRWAGAATGARGAP